jgi:sugar/nucleoside kinase (ribokinase family)
MGTETAGVSEGVGEGELDWAKIGAAVPSMIPKTRAARKNPERRRAIRKAHRNGKSVWMDGSPKFVCWKNYLTCGEKIQISDIKNFHYICK